MDEKIKSISYHTHWSHNIGDFLVFTKQMD